MAAKKKESVLVFEDGYYWIVSGKKKVNAGRSKVYADRMLAAANK
jgi:hypothetical protein